jgi:hypothetical protein
MRKVRSSQIFKHDFSHKHVITHFILIFKHIRVDYEKYAYKIIYYFTKIKKDCQRCKEKAVGNLKCNVPITKINNNTESKISFPRTQQPTTEPL